MKRFLTNVINNRSIHKDLSLSIDENLIYEREDNVIFFVCSVRNSDEGFVFRLESDDLDVWKHSTFKECLDCFSSIKDEFDKEDTRQIIEEKLSGFSVYEYYELDDTIWCLCEREELFHIVEMKEFIISFHSFTILSDAEKSLREIIKLKSPGNYRVGSYQGETPKTKSVDNSTLENISSVSELVDLILVLLENTDYLELCKGGYRKEVAYENLSHTERVITIYNLFNLSPNKRQILELVSSDFFKHMTQDPASFEARESLDYLLGLL